MSIKNASVPTALLLGVLALSGCGVVSGGG
jgi:hypothetical protein